MTKKIVFVGREVHIRTQSDVFFQEILQEIGDVTIIRRESFDAKETLEAIQEQSPDLVIFYQLRPCWKHHTRALKGPRKVWVPMYDGFAPLNLKHRLYYWLGGMEGIAFSQRVHEYFTRIRLPSLPVRYFPEVDLQCASSKQGPPYTVFLWQRDLVIGLDLIADLFEPGTVDRVIYKSDLCVSMSRKLPFKVEQLEGWLPKETLISKIQEADYYLAPRLQEGIGFSFLEAMALGKIVIGHNDATMNEYIEDGVNGHLFEGRKRLSARWPSPAELKANIVDYGQRTHTAWLDDRKRLKDFLAKK